MIKAAVQRPHNTVRIMLRLAIVFALWLCLVSDTPSLSASVAAAEPLPGQMTVQSTITLPDARSSSTLHGVILAGLGIDEEGLPDTLALIWTKQESAWIPTWALQLHSTEGLLPSPSSPSRAFGTQAVTLATVTPKWGDTYHTGLSYDARTGALAVRVSNLTTGESVYRGGFTLPTTERSFYARAGSVLSGSGAVGDRFRSHDDVRFDPVFIPWDLGWGLVHVTDGRPESVPRTRFDRQNPHPVGFRLDVASQAAGVFYIWVDGGGDRRLLTTLEASEGTRFVPLDLDVLPLGSSQVTVEYRIGGKVWLSESQRILVGNLRGSVSTLVYDPDSGHATGTVVLKPDGPLPETGISLMADLYRMEWNNQRIRYDRVPAGEQVLVDTTLLLSNEAVEIPFRIAPPDDSPALWEVHFSLELGVDVPSSLNTQDRLFSTYRPATIAADEPFVVAVIPDTQYYSLQGPQGGHPDMFIRQMEWIAANAEVMNIGLALHVGDITQLNTPDQWAVAQKSIYLLDGVVPYVLSIGNHDLGDEKGESRMTRFNTYFPPARYEYLPTFGGLLEPGALENSYHLFELAGRKYLVVALEFLPRDPALSWANEVVAAHPDHEVIILTHTYTGANGKPRTAYGSTPEKGIEAWGEAHTGYEIWDKLVRLHPNIRMVLSGHVHHDTVARNVGRGVFGNAVFEMLFCYQLAPNGGDGWLGLLQFRPSEAVVGVTVYSPTREEVKEETAGGFEVPFCIDEAEGRYRRADDVCAVDLTPEVTY